MTPKIYQDKDGELLIDMQDAPDWLLEDRKLKKKAPKKKRKRLMAEVELLLTTSKGQIVVGKISLDDGKLKTSAKKGYETLVENVRKEKLIVGDSELDPDEDPEEWLKNLPTQYSGSYFRARLTDEK